jgi:type IV secretory pathway ATPase VirB11/archaellum biosynthesis ATPase
MQRYTVYLSLETALHVSGGISTHHQEHIQLYLQHLALVKPLLLPAAIVEALELVPALPRNK